MNAIDTNIWLYAVEYNQSPQHDGNRAVGDLVPVEVHDEQDSGGHLYQWCPAVR